MARKGAKASEAELRAIDKFNRENTTSVQLRLNYRTDADILKRLSQQESKMGYIKRLIREDIEKNP